MSTYAVALINHIDDVGLQLKVVIAESWPLALDAAFPGYLENLSSVSVRSDIPEEAKTEAVNQDWEFDVVKVV